MIERTEYDWAGALIRGEMVSSSYEWTPRPRCAHPDRRPANRPRASGSFVEWIQTRDGAQNRRLSRSRRSLQGDQLACTRLEIQARDEHPSTARQLEVVNRQLVLRAHTVAHRQRRSSMRAAAASGSDIAR